MAFRCVFEGRKRVPVSGVGVFRGSNWFGIDLPMVGCLQIWFHDGASVPLGGDVTGSAVSLSLRTCDVARVDGVVCEREVWTVVGTEEGVSSA